MSLGNKILLGTIKLVIAIYGFKTRKKLSTKAKTSKSQSSSTSIETENRYLHNQINLKGINI